MSMMGDDIVQIEMTTEVSRRRIHVLETLLKFDVHNYVVDSATNIQRCFNGWMTRKLLKKVNKRVCILQRNTRRFLIESQYARQRRSAITLQSHARGSLVRRTPIGRATARIVKYERSCMSLELTLLRRAPPVGVNMNR